MIALLGLIIGVVISKVVLIDNIIVISILKWPI